MFLNLNKIILKMDDFRYLNIIIIYLMIGVSPIITVPRLFFSVDIAITVITLAVNYILHL